MRVFASIMLTLALTFGLAEASKADDLFAGLRGKDWRANFGFGSSRLNNIIGLTKDFPLDGNWRWHLGCGLGDILVGGGVSWFQNHDGDGMVFSLNAGLVGAHANVSYQFDVGTHSFLVLGAGIGSDSHIVGRSWGPIFPIVAYEYQF